MRLPRPSTRRLLLRSLARVATVLAIVGCVFMVSGLVALPRAQAAGGSLLSGEKFEGASVPDAKWIGLGDACLTGAAKNASAPGGASNLAGCQKTNKSPTIGDAGNGYLQLTDESGASTGAAVYNRAFPSSAGLEVTFQQYQYGGSGADGIGVFLTDGAYSLTKPGPQGGNVGGALGYGSIEGLSGVPHGYVGVGLDKWGNFAAQPYVGIGCSPTTNRTPNSVVIRGAGDDTSGYCILNSKTYNGLTSAPSTAPGGAQGKTQTVTVQISPTTEADPYPTITVSINGTVITSAKSKQPAPPTMKVGFTASTGGATDVHLVRNVEVRSVNPLGSINLIKQVNHDTTVSGGKDKQTFTEGDSIPYSFLVTNTGTEALSNVAVNDPKISGIKCPQTSLAPTTAMTCTGTYGPLTADDVASGTFTNTAAATGTTTSGENARSESTATTPTYRSSKLAITKKLAGTGAAAVPSTKNYTVKYSYPAGTYLPNGGSYDAGSGTLTVQPDGTATTSTRIPSGAKVTLEETPPGNETDATFRAPATYSANPVTMGDGGTTSATVTNTYDIIARPAITLNKTASPTTVSTAGEKVTFSFAVKNTGNVPLNKVGITEGNFSGSGKLGDITCPATTLAVGASINCTAGYTVTAADLDAGRITNTASAQGTPTIGGGDAVKSPNSTATVNVTQSPALSVVKSASPSVVNKAGDKVDYSFNVTNTGNTTLKSVNVTDTEFSGSGDLSTITCPSTTLAAGASTTCTATYTVTQADVDAGTITNTAVAHGTAPNATKPTDSTPSKAIVTAPGVSALDLTKTPDPQTFTKAGQQVTYSFAVTNTGNTTVSGVGIDEGDFDGSGTVSAVNCPTTTVAPGKTITCTATYTVTQDDVDNGTVTNHATAHGTGADGKEATSPERSAVITGEGVPAISVQKTADPGTITAAGQQIKYSFEVTNSGDTTLSGIKVNDEDFSGTGDLSAIDCPATSLAPGKSFTCTATYTATQADVDAGKIANTATATGNPPRGADPVTSEKSPAVVNAPAASQMTLNKSSDRAAVQKAGDVVTYSFAVKNTGNTTLKELSIKEGDFTGSGKLSTIDCPVTELAPDAETTCTATYTVTQADLDQGSIDNAATAHAKDPHGTDVPTTDAKAHVDAPAAPSLKVTKTADPQKVNAAGDKVTYSFAVENTGNVTLDKIGITEGDFSGDKDALSKITCPDGSLAPGLTVTCTATYTVTQADMDAGKITNAATAHGTPPGTDEPTDSPSDDTTVDVVKDPKLDMVKSASPTVFSKAGQEITYSFAVENTGNVTLSKVGIDDTALSGTGKLGDITCPDTTLKPGDKTTCTATYTVTQEDVDNAKTDAIDNTAHAHGTPAGSDDPVTSPDSHFTVAGKGQPALTVEKSAAPDTVHAAGETVTYTFHVTNTGDTSLSKVNVTEDSFSGDKDGLSEITCPETSLKPGASTDCTATYTVTQQDVDAGKIENTATAHGTPPRSDDPIDSKPDTATVTAPAAPHLTVDKQADPTTVTAAGAEVKYSFTVTNDGNTTLRKVGIDEGDFSGTGKISDITCPRDTLAPGEDTTCTATYTVTQEDVDAGTLENIATAHGTPPNTDKPISSDPDTATVTPAQHPSLHLDKTSDPTVITKAGQKVTYTFQVTNDGNTTITKVGINEGDFSGDKDGLSDVTCPETTTLAPGESLDCTATYTATQKDVDAGQIDNTATAFGTPPGNGDTVTSNVAPARVVGQGVPALTVTKTADPKLVGAAGDTVRYSFEVSNTGDTTLSKINVTDKNFSGSGELGTITCPATELAPGESTTCTADYTVTQADVDAGRITNTAIAHGTAPRAEDETDSDPSTETVTAPAAPALSVDKASSPTTVTAAGDKVDYTFTVTNTGNVTLDKVGITEGAFTGTGDLSKITCPEGALAPGTSVECTATYTVTQADIDAGGIDNTATAQGTPPGADTPTPSDPDTTHVEATRAPGLSVHKTASPSVLKKAGTEITYTFTVENTGNTTLSHVNVSDDEFSGTGDLSKITCPEGSLAPGKSVECTASYTASQDDVDAGTIKNTATAHATTPGTDTPVDSTPDTATVVGQGEPGLDVVKSVSPTTAHRAGDAVTYTFHVTNTGDTTLSKVGIDDTEFSGTGDLSDITCPETTLAPGKSTDCTASYTVTQEDVDAGGVDNTATAHGTPPRSEEPFTSDPSGSHLDIPEAGALQLDKTPKPGSVTAAGQEVTYTFRATNTGNTTLSNVGINEGDFSGSGDLSDITCPETTLAPGAHVDCTATYTVTQADMDADALTNTATAHGDKPKGGDPVRSDVAHGDVDVQQVSTLTVVKSADAKTFSKAGATITYTFTVHNTGNTTLSHVGISEEDFSGTGKISDITCPETTLAPGDSRECTATYQVTQADVDAGTLANTATAHGTPPGSGTPVPSEPSSTTLGGDGQSALTLSKSVSDTVVTTAGKQLTYTFHVSNTGDTTLKDVGIDEGDFSGSGDVSDITCPETTLAPGESTDCTATYTVTQANVDAGTIRNTATAHGTPPRTDTPVDSSPSTADVTLPAAPGLQVHKSADLDRISQAGQKITYSFEVSNTGNTTLKNVGIEEGTFTGSGDLSAIECPEGSLAPAQKITCTATYTVTQADVDRGSIENSATAHGTPPGDGTPPLTSDPSEVEVDVDQAPALSVVKTADPTVVKKAGTEITYSFEVSNTGNTTLHQVHIAEGDFTGTGELSAITCDGDTLAPGEKTDCTATYTATQKDVDAGKITNAATAQGTPPGNGTPGSDDPVSSPPSTVTVTGEGVAALSLSKSVDHTVLSKAGEKVTYSFLVTNTGDTSLTDVGIDDAQFSGSDALGDITCPATELEPGKSTTCIAEYTVTQADVDAGGVTNTATAHGTPPAGAGTGEGHDGPITSAESEARIQIPAAPGLTMDKTSDTEQVSRAGQRITYSFHIANTGNVTLTEVRVIDDGFDGAGKLEAVKCPTTTLAPGESVVCTVGYTVLKADLDRGALSNTAVVQADPPMPPSEPGDPGSGSPQLPPVTSGPSTAVVSPPGLVATGATVWPWVAGGVGLLVLGGAALLIARRRTA